MSHGGRDVFTDITVLTSVSTNKLDGCPHPHFMKGGTGAGKGCENNPRLCTSVRHRPAGSFHDTEACPKGEMFILFLAFAPAPGPCPILTSKELQWASLISASTRLYVLKGTCVAGFLVAEVMLKMPFSLEFSVNTEQLRQG